MNSCSTMHTIHKRDLTLDDFSTDGLTEEALDVLKSNILFLNANRIAYVSTKDRKYWDAIIKLLPESYMQNYEVAANITRQRRGHKLPEWEGLIKMLTCLPYLKEIMDE